MANKSKEAPDTQAAEDAGDVGLGFSDTPNPEYVGTSTVETNAGEDAKSGTIADEPDGTEG